MLCRKPSIPLESEWFCSWSWWMKALSRSLSIDIGQDAELVLLLTRLLYLFIIGLIVIIIMSCRRHGYPWPSLTTSPYRLLPLVGLQGHVPYPHISAECMFELVVLLLPGHMWGSIGVYHLWARLCFSGSSNLDSHRDRRQVAV